MKNLPAVFLSVLCGFTAINELRAFTIKARNLENRIIGGHDAKRRQFPYVVSIKYKNIQHFCGGSIISPQWIVTGGVCFDAKLWQDIPDLFSNLTVVAGLLNQDETNPDIQATAIKRTVTHPDYCTSDDKLINDIALVELASPFKFTEAVQPIKLPKQDQDFQGMTLTAGWGIYKRPYQWPAKLQYFKMPLISHEECEKLLTEMPPPLLSLFDSMICIAFSGGYQTICSGDSGSGLYQNNTLIGVVSWAPICFEPLKGAPSVFTKVSHYVDFIQQHVKNL